MRRTCSALFALLAAVFPAAAQQRVGVELRGGVAFPVASFQEAAPGAELSPGVSFALNVVVPRGTRGAVLLGFGQHRFRCSETGCEGAGDFVATSWSIGTRALLRRTSSAPWIAVGMLFDRSEWSFPGGDPDEPLASYLSLGGEVGVGFSVPLWDRLTLSPGARYALVNKRFPEGEPFLMHYVLVDLGVVFGF
jgi:hypothetical protein